MKIFRPGFAPVTDDPAELVVPIAVQTQVLEFTRKAAAPSPLIENPQPGIVVPHSINDKPEVEK